MSRALQDDSSADIFGASSQVYIGGITDGPVNGLMTRGGYEAQYSQRGGIDRADSYKCYALVHNKLPMQILTTQLTIT